MTLHTLADTTRTGARKIRVSHLVAALGGAALALAAVAGVAQLHSGGPHQTAQLVAAQPPQAAVVPGNISQQAARGGMAESLGDHPVPQTAGSNLGQRPLGGYAEWLLWANARAAGTSASRSNGSGALRVAYLVASQEQADTVQAGLSDAELVRIAAGESPDTAAVIVVTDQANATAMRQAIADQNSLRSSLGLPDIDVVDLREALS